MGEAAGAGGPGGGWQRPPGWNNSGDFGSSWLSGMKNQGQKIKTKTGVGWFRRLRVAEVVPKVVASGPEVGGWSEAGRRGVLGRRGANLLKQETGPGDRPGHC